MNTLIVGWGTLVQVVCFLFWKEIPSFLCTLFFFLINTILVVSTKFFFPQNSNYINCLKCTLKNKIDNKNEWGKIILHERGHIYYQS